MPNNLTTAVNLQIQNNTPFEQTISLFNNGSYIVPNAASSDYNLFTWDVSSFTFVNQQTVTIQQKLISAVSFTYDTAPINTLTFQGVCDALNTLGIGSFFTTTNGGSTYISVYNQAYTFGSLELYNTSNILSIVYDNISNVPVASASSVSDWNTFFNTTVNATVPFAKVTVIGNTVDLIGAANLHIADNLFLGVLAHTTSFTDNNTVTSIGVSSFQGNNTLITASFPVATTIGNNSFDTCIALTSIALPLATSFGDSALSGCISLPTISLPAAISLADSSLAGNTSLTTIYLPVCTQLGTTPGDDTVFLGIIGNTITLTVPLATSTDADVVYLQANNIVTLITT